MFRNLILLLAFFGTVFLTVLTVGTAEADTKENDIIAPPPKRELRGVWIATVANIDWPSRSGLPIAQQKSELINILDNHQRAGINAIYLQIRPSADAFYGKGEEPWSRFLTGKQGQSPNPYYDPLEFAIEEAHKRGMEMHPWFNPYRATFDLVQTNVSPNHITRKKPEWFFTYGGKKWFNPGIPEVREYIIQVILNVVRQYDIDGVHFDDYFYPYPDGNKPIPDTETFRKYGAGFSTVADWRRNNVNQLVHALSDSIRATKHYIRFGISPFGIWDNVRDHPQGSESNGFSGYRQLYADAIRWTSEGWVDYVTPQLYFPFNYRAAPYEKLVDWWSRHTYGRHLYIGHASYRADNNTEGWKNRSQIPDQIRYLRDRSESQGSVFYSSKSIVGNLAGIRDSLQYDLYKYKALPPQMLWLDSVPPRSPSGLTAITINEGAAIKLDWLAPDTAEDGEFAYGYVVYRFNEGENINLEDPRNILHISYQPDQLSYTDSRIRKEARYVYVVTALDRLKNESQPSNYLAVVIDERQQAELLGREERR